MIRGVWQGRGRLEHVGFYPVQTFAVKPEAAFGLQTRSGCRVNAMERDMLLGWRCGGAGAEALGALAGVAGGVVVRLRGRWRRYRMAVGDGRADRSGLRKVQVSVARYLRTPP